MNFYTFRVENIHFEFVKNRVKYFDFLIFRFFLDFFHNQKCILHNEIKFLVAKTLLYQRLYTHCIYSFHMLHKIFTNEYFDFLKMYKSL